MINIFVIGGTAGSGKSTLGELLKKELDLIGKKPCIMHITDPLYNYAKNYFNWDGDLKNKPREFLQEFGIDIIKNKLNKPNFLLNRLYEDIEILSNYFDTFIITDARLKSEFCSIKKKYNNVITIKVIRDNYDNGLTDKEKNHITEKDLENYNDFDYIIKDASLNSLKNKAKEIVSLGGVSYE